MKTTPSRRRGCSRRHSALDRGVEGSASRISVTAQMKIVFVSLLNLNLHLIAKTDIDEASFRTLLAVFRPVVHCSGSGYRAWQPRSTYAGNGTLLGCHYGGGSGQSFDPRAPRGIAWTENVRTRLSKFIRVSILHPDDLRSSPPPKIIRGN